MQPSSATVVVESNSAGGPMIRKLFHAVDDELLRVPNAVSVASEARVLCYNIQQCQKLIS